MSTEELIETGYRFSREKSLKITNQRRAARFPMRQGTCTQCARPAVPT